MYLYKVGYFEMDSEPVTTLAHDTLYSQEAFEELVAGIMAHIALSAGSERYNQPEYIFERAVDVLIEEHGFYNPDIQASFNPFGAGSIDQASEHAINWLEYEDDPHLNLIRKKYTELKSAQ